MSGILHPTQEKTTKEQIQELNDQLFNKRLIHKMLVQISKDPTICTTIKHKLHETIMHANILQMSELQISEGNCQMIFDLADLNLPEFTCEEQEKIVKLVDERLLDYLKELQDTAKEKDDEDRITEKILFEARANLQKIMSSYANNLMELQKLLTDVHNLQQNILPSVCIDKERVTTLEHRINDIKMQLIDQKIQMQTMLENEVSLDAYRDLVKHIHAEQEQCEIEIKQMRELKVKYKMTDCQQYQLILKEYTDYYNVIERMERMHKLMHK